MAESLFFSFFCSGEHKKVWFYLTGGFFKLPFLSLESYSPFLNKNNIYFYSFLDIFSNLNTSHSSSSLHQDAPIWAVILQDCPSEGHPNGATGKPIDLQINQEPLGGDRTTHFTPQSLVYEHEHSLPAADKLIFIYLQLIILPH